MPAATRIDDAGALRQLRKKARIDDAGGITGERQQADQDLGAVEKRIELVGAEVALHAWNRFLRSTPAGDIEAEIGQLARGVAAEHAHAENADLAVAGHRIEDRRPFAAALRLLDL